MNQAIMERDRVRRHTDPEILRQIDDDIEQSIRFYSTQPDEVLNARIAELDEEWSMERVLETNASALAFAGTALGLTVSKKWLALPVIVTGFLFMHAAQGWCPPVPLLRNLGVRTRSEIDREKFALKALRGDFQDVPTERTELPDTTQPQEILAAVNR